MRLGLLTLGIIVLFIVSGCNESDFITISKDGSLSSVECEARGLSNKIIMLESKYCTHCRDTLPIFQEACAEEGIESLIIDISSDTGRAEIQALKLNVQFTPTFLFGCKHVVGVKTKEEYLDFLNGWKNER